ncbi:MAG: biotin--[acetyl-CoA-carboxylase] ligase [Bacteroidota bacterium]
MDTKFFGHNLIRLKSVDSTNKYAIELIPKIDPIEGAVVWALEQESGRGRNNNIWESEVGKNLTFSIILYPEFLNIQDQFYLSKAISLGVRDYISLYSDEVKIKWPNDIYVGDRKISGILIENSVINEKIISCVVGIGLNVNQTVFKSTAPNPTSLKLILKNDLDLNESLENICACLESRYMQLQNEDYEKLDKDYQLSMYRINEIHSYNHDGTIFQAKLISVNVDGSLVLEKEDGTLTAFDLNELNFIQ